MLPGPVPRTAESLSEASSEIDGLPPRKRRRPALSCVPCRRRKVRCDRDEPCGPCSRMKLANACVYVRPTSNCLENRCRSTDNVRSSSGPCSNYEATHLPRKTPITPVSMSAALPDDNGRCGTLEVSTCENGFARSESRRTGRARVVDLLDQRSDENLGLEILRSYRTLAERVASLEGYIMQRKTSSSLPEVRSELRSDPETFGRKDSEAENYRSMHIHDGEGPSSVHGDITVATAAPRMRLAPNTSKFWGPSHYIHSFDEQLKPLLPVMKKTAGSEALGSHFTKATNGTAEGNREIREIVESYEHLRSLRKLIKQQSQVDSGSTMNEVKQSMPSRNTIRALVETYKSTLEPVFRILDAQSFYGSLDAYFETPETVSDLYLTQLLLVVAIGSASRLGVGSSGSETLPVHTVKRLIYAAQSYLSGPDEKSLWTEEAVRCWALLLLARLTNSVGTKEQNWTLARAMIGSAYGLGLHRDPRYLPKMSLLLAEGRRRLWATVLELVLAISLDANMPPLISFLDFDCEPPSNFNNLDLMDSSDKPSPVSRFTDSSPQILLHSSFRARYEIVKSLNNFKEQQSFSNALDLELALRNAKKEMAKKFGAHSNSPDLDHGDMRFCHRFLINILSRYTLYLHHPFAIAAKTDPRLYLARYSSFQAALSLASDLRSASPKISDDGQDSVLALALKGTGMFKAALSFDTILILCREASLLQGESDILGEPSRLTHVATMPADSQMRELIIQNLEYVLSQLLNVVKSGDPSCKRYIFLSVKLAQLQAAEEGRPINEAARHALKESMTTCCEIMKSLIDPTEIPCGPDSSIDGVAQKPFGSKADASPSVPYDAVDLGFDTDWLYGLWDSDCEQIANWQSF